MKAVSLDPAATEPVEQELAALRSRHAFFNQKVQELDGQITAAQDAAAKALVDEDPEGATAAAEALQRLRSEREVYIDAARLADERLTQRQADLKTIHSRAEQAEANHRYAAVVKASADVQQALERLEAAAIQFDQALTATRKLAPKFMDVRVQRHIVSRALFSQAPTFAHLAGDLQGIHYPPSGLRDKAPLTQVITDEPNRRPYPNLKEE